MKKGFTLIELIVVIAIIAILAAIIAPNAFRAIEKAKTTKFVSEYKGVKAGVYALYGDVGTFPAHYEALAGPLVTGGGGWSVRPGWDGPYLEKLPEPPWKTTGAVTYWWQDTAGDAGKACWGSRAYFFCIQPGFPATAQVAIDRVIDGGDGPTTGSIRKHYCGAGAFETSGVWTLFAQE
ncbi:MAG: prepilin-type N-terminal cleavage/methylation domain-containing protein [Candidatus Omnitrophota bacterium]